MSPGFGGATAVLAASLAFIAATRNRGSEDRRAREVRWWEQARWASDLLMKSEDEQAMGIAALAQLAEEAPDVEAAKFAAVALRSVLFEGDDVEVMDDSEEGEAEWEEQETEEH